MGIEVDFLQQAEYTMIIEYSGGNPIYVGEAKPGTSQSDIGWRIKRITWVGSDATEIEWASATTLFDKIWDSRASYAYS